MKILVLGGGVIGVTTAYFLAKVTADLIAGREPGVDLEGMRYH